MLNTNDQTHQIELLCLKFISNSNLEIQHLLYKNIDPLQQQKCQDRLPGRVSDQILNSC